MVVLFMNLLLALNSTACTDEIKVVYNNKAVQFKNGYPIIYKGRMFLGLRATGEMLGLDVSWDKENQIAFVHNADRTTEIRIQMKQGQSYVNDELAYSPEAMMIDNRIFVPVRFIAEVFSKKVVYVPETRIVHINDTDMNQQLW
jgi:hypothetical protein